MRRFSLPKFLSFGNDTQKDIDFKIHAAVDFGTDGCGLAFAYNGKVFHTTRWGNQRYAFEKKPQNNIVLDENNQCLFFGSKAKEQFSASHTTTYISPRIDARSINIITQLVSYTGGASQISKNWKLFTRFKMSLYQDRLKRFKVNHQGEEKVDIHQTLTAEDGRTCSAEYVFIAAFKKIQEAARESMGPITKYETIKDEEIQWIITVPSIWNDAAKHHMISWATNAGLIDRNIRNQCKIVYEPDCASLALQHLVHHPEYHKHIEINPMYVGNASIMEDEDEEDEDSKNGEGIGIFKEREKYILIDAGGGTLDVVCHEICGKYGVREILPPSGGKWGSCYVDDQYVIQLEILFGKAWMDEFREKAPRCFIELMCMFQAAKKTFCNDSQKQPDTTHDVEVPGNFLDFMEAKLYKMNSKSQAKTQSAVMQQQLLHNTTPNEIKDLIEKTKFFRYYEDENQQRHWLRINTIVWSSMFDYVLNPAIMHITKLLNEPRLMRNCKYLCLVGGFSCSPYFQYRMNDEFGVNSKWRLDVIAPKKPILSVVEGAAYFGITTNYIRSRILSKTYGVRLSAPLEQAVRIGISKQHIDKHAYRNEHKKRVFVNNYFHVMGRRGDEVLANTVVKHTVYRSMPKDMFVNVPILCSDLESPLIVDDGYELATVRVEFSDKKASNMQADIEFDFSETVIKVYTKTKNNDKRKPVELKYLD